MKSPMFILVTDSAFNMFICLIYDRDYCSLLGLESELTTNVSNHSTVVICTQAWHISTQNSR
jgi:hypothetical protein